MLLMRIQAHVLEADADSFSADTFSLLCFESLRSFPGARPGLAFDLFNKFSLVGFRKLFFPTLSRPEPINSEEQFEASPVINSFETVINSLANGNKSFLAFFSVLSGRRPVSGFLEFRISLGNLRVTPLTPSLFSYVWKYWKFLSPAGCREHSPATATSSRASAAGPAIV